VAHRQEGWLFRQVCESDPFFPLSYYGMTASVFCNGMVSDSFIVGNSVKQGCVLAPILFLIFFAMMLFVAFRDNDDGFEYRLDGGISTWDDSVAGVKSVTSLCGNCCLQMTVPLQLIPSVMRSA